MGMSQVKFAYTWGWLREAVVTAVHLGVAEGGSGHCFLFLVFVSGSARVEGFPQQGSHRAQSHALVVFLEWGVWQKSRELRGRLED